MSAPPEFIALFERVEKIKNLFREIEAARRLPIDRANDVRCMAITSTRGYGDTSDAQKIIAERMIKMAIAEETKAGEVARDLELKRIASYLELLRDDLPALAQTARFAILDTVRELRA